MIKIAVIAAWEIRRRLSSRMYAASLFLTPLLLFGITFAPLAFREKPVRGTQVVLVEDTDGVFTKRLTAINAPIRRGAAPVFVIVRAMPGISTLHASGSAKGSAAALVQTIRHDSTISILHSPELGQTELLLLKSLCIAAAQQNNQNAEYRIPRVHTTAAAEAARGSGGQGAVFFLMLLFFTVTFAGGTFARSLMEEKTSKLADVLLSSCSVEQLLWGKIAGTGALTFVQVALWGAMGVLTAGSGVFGGMTAHTFLGALTFCVTGFILYVAVFTGLGASAQQEQEVQTLFVYLSLLLLVPLLAAGYIEQHPLSAVTLALQYFPLFTPSVLIIKIASGSAMPLEFAGALLLIGTSTLFFTRMAGTAFRAAVLQENITRKTLLKRVLRGTA